MLKTYPAACDPYPVTVDYTEALSFVVSSFTDFIDKLSQMASLCTAGRLVSAIPCSRRRVSLVVQASKTEHVTAAACQPGAYQFVHKWQPFSSWCRLLDRSIDGVQSSLPRSSCMPAEMSRRAALPMIAFLGSALALAAPLLAPERALAFGSGFPGYDMDMVSTFTGF